MVRWDVCPWDICPLGVCPWDICPLDVCPWDICPKTFRLCGEGEKRHKKQENALISENRQIRINRGGFKITSFETASILRRIVFRVFSGRFILMPGRRKFFLIMFQAELQDSLEDIEYLKGTNESRYRSNEITSYVYNENKAFLLHEAAGLKNLISFIDSFNPGDYQTVTELASAVDEFFRKKVEEFDDPEAVYGIIRRKIKKILAYVEQQDS
jgi:hypothetical protein